MPEKRQFRAIKGTRDILPLESSLWNWFEQTAHEVFESYNFREIRLPIFEDTELFARSIGVETDIVSKEMFAFEDHEHQDLDRLRVALINSRRTLHDDPGYEPYRSQVSDLVREISEG